MHGVAGKAACLGEAARPEFRRYNQSVLDKSRALAGALGQRGLRIVSGGTDTGLMLVDLGARGVTGDVAAKALEKAGLAVNKNMIPFDPRPPEAPSGLRLSSNAGTTRGFGVAEFQAIAGWIDRVLQDPVDQLAITAVAGEVRALCAPFTDLLTIRARRPPAEVERGFIRTRTTGRGAGVRADGARSANGPSPFARRPVAAGGSREARGAEAG